MIGLHAKMTDFVFLLVDTVTFINLQWWAIIPLPNKFTTNEISTSPQTGTEEDRLNCRCPLLAQQPSYVGDD